MLKKIRATLIIIGLIHLSPFLVMCCTEVIGIPVITERVSLEAFDSQNWNAEIIGRERLALLIRQLPGDSLFAPLATNPIPFLSSAQATSCDDDYSFLVEYLESVEIYSKFATFNYKKGEDLTELFLMEGGNYGLYKPIETELTQSKRVIVLYFSQKILDDSIGFVSYVKLSDGRVFQDSTVVRW
jgi:hypothetical protein